ncbi:MAG: carboxy terminal-processing peptidase [Cytophagaceae bacterium]|nr:carboxy terminal-processing peptidase [Cytophagaceae bacterium]MBK9933445.1 carboxy terminal-processing peptidase [Cytophagaceae bacterium]MBL0302838.1 carboxy terminal-processing peptidase [Cytophagaceae bacterium]MBL0325665.1 carboxy terminal-processing peptidase [Cytophagaceae bacterium]
MKKTFLTWLGTLSVLVSIAQTEAPKYSYADLEPTASQTKVQAFVTQFLNNYHYSKFSIDDSLSAKVWKSFIDNVDGSRAYFTAEEIKDFEKYQYKIDEALLSGDVDAPFEVFNLYRKKYKERHAYIKNLLSKPLDFTTNDTYEVNRSKSPWAKSEAELDKVWDKIILSQALSLKLGGSTDSAIVATMNKRYDMYETRVLKWRSEDVFQTFVNSFTETIDPHTSYMIPSTAAQFNIEMSQSLEGIGATLQNEGDYVMIKEIIPGGPLFKSGQGNKNDYIVAVAQGDDGDYQDIIGWLTDDAVKLIRGKKGTIVRLKLLASDAPAGSEPRILRLEREKIKLEEAVAQSKIIDVKHDKKDFKIGMIEIPMFYRDFEDARKGGDFQSTTKDVKKFLLEFKEKGVDGVLIDLRNNGGGSLTEAINLSGLFISEGPVVQRRSSRQKVDVEYDTDKELVYSGPLMILQNRFSASASEIFAGAIQDYKRGIIVGERSYGKGTVQQLVDLDQFLNSPRNASRNNNRGSVAGNGNVAMGVGFENKERYGQLKLTTEKFYRITGNSTQLKGVEPDIALPSPFDPDEMGESSQPTALPYDQVELAEFEKQGNINDKLINKLNSKFQSRLKSDQDLKDLVSDLDEYKILKEKNEYSLNYEIRKKEKEDSEKNRKAVKKISKSNSSSDDDDVYLNESEKILCDLISNTK